MSLRLIELGLKNAVASMGTALTPEHVQHLFIYQKGHFDYDGDKDLDATAKALDVLQDLELEIVRIPDQMDPDSTSKDLPEDLASLLKNSRISKVEFLMHYWKPQYIENLQAQIEFVEKLAPMIAQDAPSQRKTPIFISWQIYCQTLIICRLSRLSIIVACINGRRIKVVDDQERRIFQSISYLTVG